MVGVVLLDGGAQGVGVTAGRQPHSTPTASRSWPAITTSWMAPPPACTISVRSVPTLTQVPVVSLKSSATRPSNTRPGARIVGVDETAGVADPVEALVVERGGRQRGLVVARRDVRPLHPQLELAPVGNELEPPRPASARRCSRDRLSGSAPSFAAGDVSVTPQPVVSGTPLATALNRCQVSAGRSAAAYNANRSREKRCAANAGSASRCGTSAAYPAGTLKYDVGAPSRRFVTVVRADAGPGGRRRRRACRRDYRTRLTLWLPPNVWLQGSQSTSTTAPRW